MYNTHMCFFVQMEAEIVCYIGKMYYRVNAANNIFSIHKWYFLMNLKLKNNESVFNDLFDVTDSFS